MTQKWLHVTGICGKATSNIAIAFSKLGWFVTGSDIQFSPPASTNITQNQIPFSLGYSYKHLTKEFWENTLNKSLQTESFPNLVLIVETSSTKNKEYLFAKKNNIDIRPFSQILEEYMVSKTASIVVVGTAGKTTTTALLAYALDKLNLAPNYMIGAEISGFPSISMNPEASYSVIEGDEFYSPNLSRGAKFLFYHPHYLVIPSIGWEHQDVYPTQESYLDAFRQIVLEVPENGFIVAKANDEKIENVLQSAKSKIFRYSFSDSPIENIYTINKKGEVFFGEKFLTKISTNLIGKYNRENVLGAYITLTNLFPANQDSIVEKLSEFMGVKKRLEKKLDKNNIIVIDDFAPAPNRAKVSLEVLKEEYPNHNIICIYEPNSGSRVSDKDLLNQVYSKAFDLANLVIVPTLSTFDSNLVDHNTLVEMLTNLDINAMYIDNLEIANWLEKNIDRTKQNLVVFYSSYRLELVENEFTSKMNT